MAPSKLQRAIGAVKDQTSIGLAMVANSASLSDLDVAIVKATRHEEYPPDERYIREILSLTTYSHVFVTSCVRTIARRLNKTKKWVVALKSLMLIQRLLAEGDPAYEQEFFFATRGGMHLLNMSDFRDTSGGSNAWDYSAFVRTYSLYLDEKLEMKMQGGREKNGATNRYPVKDEDKSKGKEEEVEVALKEMKTENLFIKVVRNMQLLDRFLACKPTNAAKNNRVVIMALYPILKESYQLFYDTKELLGVLINRFLQLDVSSMVTVHEIFCRIGKQYDELDAFYNWCKAVGIGRCSEFPDVERISQHKLDMMEEYIQEKSVTATGGPDPSSEPVEQVPEEDMNAVKALPAAEAAEIFIEEVTEEDKEEKEPEIEDKKSILDGDLLNLGEDAPTTEDHGDKLALALFDGCTATTTTAISPWEAFKGTSDDWEMTLVQSSSYLSNQKASFAGNFDNLILDGMYQQGAMAQAVASSGMITTGSASSVALGSAGRPAMLALPAPASAEGGESSSSMSSDPFAASLTIPPPAYVQMSEMEKKQRFLVEEQMMWQEYQRNGMRNQQNPYNGGYTASY